MLICRKKIEYFKCQTETKNYDYEDGFLNHDGKIVCGAAMFCACGLPKEAEFDSLEDAKTFVENIK